MKHCGSSLGQLSDLQQAQSVRSLQGNGKCPVDDRRAGGAARKDTGITMPTLSSFITNGGKGQMSDIRTPPTNTHLFPMHCSRRITAKEIFENALQTPSQESAMDPHCLQNKIAFVYVEF